MSDGGDQTRRRLKPSIQMGRLLATGFTAFLLLFAIGEAATEGLSLEAAGIGVAIVLGLAVLAVVTAWWDPSLGVYSLAAVSLAMAILVVVTANTNRGSAVIILSAPYLFSSILIWLGVWRMARS